MQRFSPLGTWLKLATVGLIIVVIVGIATTTPRPKASAQVPGSGEISIEVNDGTTAQAGATVEIRSDTDGDGTFETVVDTITAPSVVTLPYERYRAVILVSPTGFIPDPTQPEGALFSVDQPVESVPAVLLLTPGTATTATTLPGTTTTTAASTTSSTSSTSTTIALTTTSSTAASTSTTLATTSITAVPATTTTAVPATTTTSTTQTMPYVIQRGDQLGRIAAAFGLSLDELLTLNLIENPDLIFPGQTINLPTGATSTTQSPRPVTPTPTVQSAGETAASTTTQLATRNNPTSTSTNSSATTTVLPSTLLPNTALPNTALPPTVEQGTTTTSTTPTTSTTLVLPFDDGDDDGRRWLFWVAGGLGLIWLAFVVAAARRRSETGPSVIALILLCGLMTGMTQTSFEEPAEAQVPDTTRALPTGPGGTFGKGVKQFGFGATNPISIYQSQRPIAGSTFHYGNNYRVISTGDAAAIWTFEDVEPSLSINESDAPDTAVMTGQLQPGDARRLINGAHGQCLSLWFMVVTDEPAHLQGEGFNDQVNISIGGHQVTTDAGEPFDTDHIDLTGGSAGSYRRSSQPYRLVLPHNGANDVPMRFEVIDGGDNLYDTAIVVSEAHFFNGSCPDPQRLDVFPDTDRDGLPDDWEINGVDVDGDGTIDIDLPAMDADPMRADVFLQFDWVEENAPFGGLSPLLQPHMEMCFPECPEDPTITVYQLWSESFAGIADIVNPDGSTGITLHVDSGPETPITWGKPALWGSESASAVLSTAEYGHTTRPNYLGYDNLRFPLARRAAFRYVVQMGNTSFAGGKAMAIALGQTAWGGNLMHEVFHSGGLTHGGDIDDAYKENFWSVMSYKYAVQVLDGVQTDRLNTVELDEINRDSLDESAGLGPYEYTERINIRKNCGTEGGTKVVASGTPKTSIDWNCDGVISGPNPTTGPFMTSPDEREFLYLGWSRLGAHGEE